MGCGSCACCLETLYSVQTRQDTEVLLKRGLSDEDFLDPGEVRENLPFRVMGHDTIRISVQTDADVRIRVEANCKEDGSGPYRQIARFDTIPDPAGGNFIETQVIPSAPFVRIVEEELNGPVMREYCVTVEAQPIGSDPGRWAGIGSQIGPGENIVTKADIVVAAAVETNLILAADIPPGTRRISLKNVGANPIRIKEDGGAGGAGRGQELAAGQTMSIGTRGGAIQVIDGFSTAGTTIGFFFEKD